MHHTVLNKINEKFKDDFFFKQKDLLDRVSGVHWVSIGHPFATSPILKPELTKMP